jgi:cyclopropane fatty-acyl-phospholipid synthase-like methyltransferase
MTVVQRLAALSVVTLVCLGVTMHAQHQHPGGGTMPADHMEHRFDNAEEYAKRFDDPARDEWQMPARVIEALGLAPGMSVADIGAGTGYFAVRLAKTAAAPTVYAADIEPSMVEYMRTRAAKEKLPNVVPVLAAADTPNLPRPVDLVLIVDTYHHIGNRVSYFRALRTSMTPSARLAIIDFRKDSPEGPPVEFRFTSEQIEQELREAGFVLAEHHDFLPRQQFLVFVQAP